MTKLRDALEAADPIRRETPPTDDQRATLRHAVVAAAAHRGAPPQRARSRMRMAVVLTFASIVTAMIAASAAWQRGSTAQAAVRFEVRLAEEQPAAGLRAARVASNRTIYLHPEIVVTNGDIERSGIIPGDTPTHFWIDVRLNAAGAAKMRQATMNHLGRPVAILIDGEVVSAPTVKSPIGGAAVISGDFTRADAERIVNGMTITP